MCVLYYELNTQITALESLGVTKDKYAAFIYPLIESALPVETLKIWERLKSSSSNNMNNDLNNM